ncbi:MAG: large subunit ribosomal protein [Patescibacteria group bacterium]|jgi:large subunit ribosomal protein L11|nr:large subunit ribosomal protein [Patescibacteria group bacterium]
MAETKKISAKVKMVIPGGGATPAPPVGSSLGQHGVNMMDFINPFNEQTADRKGKPTPVSVTIYEDKSMSFTIKGTPTSTLIKEALKLKKASGVPNKDKVGKLTKDQLTKIAEEKMNDLNANDIEAAKKVVAGTARSMGIEVEK